MILRGGPWYYSKSHRRRFCHVEACGWDFEMAQLQIGSKSRSRVKTPRWLTFSDLKLWDGSKFEAVIISNRVSVRILSYLRVFGLNKWAREFWHVIVDFEPIWSWAISKSHAYASTWQYLLRWLFEPSQGPPRILSVTPHSLSQLNFEIRPLLVQSDESMRLDQRRPCFLAEEFQNRGTILLCVWHLNQKT